MTINYIYWPNRPIPYSLDAYYGYEPITSEDIKLLMGLGYQIRRLN